AAAQTPRQRAALSATERPVEEVAHFLGGVEPRKPAKRETKSEELAEFEHEWTSDEEVEQKFSPVTIVNASEPKRLELKVEVPVEDMARIGQAEEMPSGPAAQGPRRTRILGA